MTAAGDVTADDGAAGADGRGLPRVIGNRYALLERLGEGGTAVVHAAVDRTLGRPVAVKVLKGAGADPAARARFDREARSVAALQHPGIVAVHDAGEVALGDGTVLPYLVMERVDGVTLRDLLAAHGVPPLAEALRFTADVCAALTYSHGRGIVHRDVKPGNVMLTHDGRIKVLDFGLSATSGDDRLTLTAQAVGTPAYISPEQARGEQGGAASDVYATGCLLYELVCGRPPFRADTPAAVVYQHLSVAPTPPSLEVQGVPPGLDTVVLTALAKDPAHRYASVEALRDDVLRVQNGRPPVGTGPVAPGAGPYPDPARTSVMAAPPPPVRSLPVDRPPVHAYEIRPQGRRPVAPLVLAAAGVVAVVATLAALTLGGGGEPAALPLTTGSPTSSDVATDTPAPTATATASKTATRATKKAASSTRTATKAATTAASAAATTAATTAAPAVATTSSSATAVARPAATISPTTGSSGTVFVLAGTGWTPGEVDVAVDDLPVSVAVTAAADGTFRYKVNANHEYFSIGFPPGTHTAHVTQGSTALDVTFEVS